MTSTHQDSIWEHKPWWCQPWSIVLTGMVAVAASWWLLHRWWVSLPVLVAVLFWWMLFLVLVPSAYNDQNSKSIETR